MQQLTNQKNKSTAFSSNPNQSFFSGNNVYPKITINAPNDQYEQEADAVADRVMRMGNSTTSSENGEDQEKLQTKPLFAVQKSEMEEDGIQRKCGQCNEEDTIQRQTEKDELMPKSLMRKAENGGYEASPELDNQIKSSKGGGSPIPNHTLAFMNNSFGSDFSNVRVHTGSKAADMSQGIQAKAFTHGSDIYFNQGQYSPNSNSGKQLLAHELTHVVQQGGSSEVKRKPETSDDMYRDPNYKQINEAGIVYQETGANIRSQPTGGPDTLLKHAKQNDKVFILKHNPNTRWYAVTTDDGTFGYVADWLVWKNLPEPNVKVLKIPSGRSAIGIAEEHYGEKFKSWGSDLRFVVNALAYANNRDDHNGVGKPGIYKTGGNDQSWAKTKVNKDVYIWLPSVEFLNALKGKVSTGSITYEIWDTVKSIAHAIAFGAAFIGGIIHGVVDGVVALIKGIVDLIISLIKGTIWSQLKELWKIITTASSDELLELAKEAFLGWLNPWLKKTKSSNPFKSGHAYGYIAGRIIFEIVSLFVGGGFVLKAAGKIGAIAAKFTSKVGKLIAKSKAVQKLATGLSSATGKAKRGIDRLRWTFQKIKLGGVVRKVRANAKARKYIPFISESSLHSHFAKHAGEFMRLYGRKALWELKIIC